MPTWAGCVIRHEETVDSTNRVARQWAREGAPHGAAVIARAQTGGRGRRGRDWVSPAGLGLWLSVVLRLAESAWRTLSFAAALAVSDACEATCGIAPQIKWPNDLLLNGRKISGILIEMEGSAAVLGIGVNLRQRAEDFPEALRARAGSLLTQTGADIPPEAFLPPLLDAIEKRVCQEDILDAYTARCVTLGSAVRVIEASGSFLGTAQSLDASGALIVLDTEGILRRVQAADVSVRGENGF